MILRKTFYTVLVNSKMAKYFYSYFLDSSFDDIVQTNILIRERNFGVMEGKPITDYVNAANSAGIRKAYKFVPKGGESSDAVRQRAKEFLKVAYSI